MIGQFSFWNAVTPILPLQRPLLEEGFDQIRSNERFHLGTNDRTFLVWLPGTL